MRHLRLIDYDKIVFIIIIIIIIIIYSARLDESNYNVIVIITLIN